MTRQDRAFYKTMALFLAGVVVFVTAWTWNVPRAFLDDSSWSSYRDRR